MSFFISPALSFMVLCVTLYGMKNSRLRGNREAEDGITLYRILRKVCLHSRQM